MSSTPPYNEHELLVRIADGDEQAFTSFIYEHTDRIYSYILKITKSEQWAEELVQDVWVQVWTARKEFAVLENPIGYLHRMALNRSRDWLRKNKRELELQYQLYQYLIQPASNPIFEKDAADRLKNVLQQNINSLPPQRRKIFELKQAGMSYEQIAVRLNISKNTVRNQMVSTLSTLRASLKKQLDKIIIFFF